jgi:hypothetical protein
MSRDLEQFELLDTRSQRRRAAVHAFDPGVQHKQEPTQHLPIRD